LQSIKGIMVPVFQVDDSMLFRSTAAFPAPFNIRPLPAMMITEKGEPLDEFIVRAEPDFFTSMQVLTLLACVSTASPARIEINLCVCSCRAFSVGGLWEIGRVNCLGLRCQAFFVEHCLH
jgi:hypothetical protein